MQDQTKLFLARVLAWPQPGDAPAYGNIHNTFIPTDGVQQDKKGRPRYPWNGKAFQDAGAAANFVAYQKNNAAARDIYFCTSTQFYAERRVSTKGTPWLKAHRSLDNVSKLKTLFIDIDMSEGKADKSKGYGTAKELSAALAKFLTDTGLPKPTIMVFSGGGMHVYWTLMQPLDMEQWLPLAYALANAANKHGLQCDTGCTIDAARILRVPGTVNHKYDPPRKVAIVGSPLDFDYSNERISNVLDQYRVVVPKTTQNSSMALFPPKAPIIGSDLASGVDMSNMAPIKLDTLIGTCGFITEALNTGGADFANPLWNLTTLIATFTEGGRADAHRMAQGHDSYGPGETDELFDRKELEKVTRNLGWPRCVSISASGCTSCQTCPLYAQGKSPLNFAEKVTLQGNPTTTLLGAGLLTGTAPVIQVPVSGSVGATVPGVGQQDPDLPDGYIRTPIGRIMEREVQDDGSTEWHEVCAYPMVNPWLERDPWTLHFTTEAELGRKSSVEVQLDEVGTADLRKKLQGQGMMISIYPKAMQTISEFIMSWITKLQATRDAVVSSVPFGWATSGGKVKGFVYSSQMHTVNGVEVASNTDPQLSNQYSPTGDVKPWLDASRMIADQKRPALDAIIASAFAAPLVKFSGHSGLLLSAFSIESGIGKSTAIKIAQAVWGNPIKAVQSLSDTQNSVLHKLGELKSLPMYWDELKSEDDTKKFIDTVFRLTLGKEKSRLNARVDQREVGTWETMLISASNDSLLDGVAFRSRGSTAGLYRVFEYTVAPAGQATPGQIPASLAQRVVAKLNDNYGHIGLDYAGYLGGNIPKVEKDVADMMFLVEQELSARPDERFWVATISTLLQGATYANERGYTDIDIEALKAFLYDTMTNMRVTRNSTSVDMRSHSNVAAIVSRFLNEHRSRNTIKTNIIYSSRGRPILGIVELRSGDMARMEAIHVHIGEDDKLIRFSRDYFRRWLIKNELPGHVLLTAVKDELRAKEVQGRLGSGTAFVTGSEILFEIDMKNSPLINIIDEA